MTNIAKPVLWVSIALIGLWCAVMGILIFNIPFNARNIENVVRVLTSTIGQMVISSAIPGALVWSGSEKRKGYALLTFAAILVVQGIWFAYRFSALN